MNVISFYCRYLRLLFLVLMGFLYMFLLTLSGNIKSLKNRLLELSNDLCTCRSCDMDCRRTYKAGSSSVYKVWYSGGGMCGSCAMHSVSAVVI